MTERTTTPPPPLSLHDAHMRPVVYEKEDVSPIAIVKWAVGLVAFTLVTAGAMLIFVPVAMRYQAKRDPRPTVMRVADRPLLAPGGPQTPDGGVLLQTTPQMELDAYRAEQARGLTSYGVDRTTGSVSIPIDRAMQLYVERGGTGGALPPVGVAAQPAHGAPAPTAAIGSDAAPLPAHGRGPDGLQGGAPEPSTHAAPSSTTASPAPEPPR